MTMIDDPDYIVVCHALNVWANYIETGDPAMSANDAVRAGRSDEIKPLDSYQLQMVRRMRDLTDRVRRDGGL